MNRRSVNLRLERLEKAAASLPLTDEERLRRIDLLMKEAIRRQDLGDQSPEAQDLYRRAGRIRDFFERARRCREETEAKEGQKATRAKKSQGTKPVGEADGET